MLEKVTFPESFYIHQHHGEARTNRSADAMMRDALADPVDFPTLEQFVLPGDVVALALMGNLPQPVLVAQAVLAALNQILDDAEIVFVVSPVHVGAFDPPIQKQLAEGSRLQITFEVHDPDDQGAVACIANNQAGEPVYINRRMFDADVVIPVGTLLEGNSVQANSYFPEFSSKEVLQRFKNPPAGVTVKELDGEVRMVEANLGAEFSVLVVRGPGGDVSAVRAGSSRSIRDSTSSEMDALWTIECQPQGDLIVATLEGNPDQHSWQDIFQALVAAAGASQTVAQIVICCGVTDEPNEEETKVLQLQFEVDLDAKFRNSEQLTDSQRMIPGVLESTSVYLLSRLSQDCVEEAGLGYIESEEQIQRIVDRAASGVLLRDAHLCKVKPAESVQAFDEAEF